MILLIGFNYLPLWVIVGTFFWPAPLANFRPGQPLSIMVDRT